MKKLFNKSDITPSCSYCVPGRTSPNKESILCLKKGVVGLDYSCKRFKYDPLKRKPIRPRTIDQATRISGVNPADISMLILAVKKAR